LGEVKQTVTVGYWTSGTDSIVLNTVMFLILCSNLEANMSILMY